MLALTVWQPWASLIMAMVKPYEFRGRPLPAYFQGKPTVMHAGARKVRREEIADLILRLRDSDQAWSTGLLPGALPLLEAWHQTPERLPLASGLGTVVFGKSVRADELPGYRDSDRSEHINYGWPVHDVTPFAHPVPAKGAQGFWTWAGERP